jgi:hypothetical protein
VVRAAGIEPAQAYRPYGFSYHDGFRRLASRLRAELRSWPGLYLHRGVRQKSVRGRCCPSSLYTCPPYLRPEGLARDCHVKGSPDFEQFYISGFPESTQFSFKSFNARIILLILLQFLS